MESSTHVGRAETGVTSASERLIHVVLQEGRQTSPFHGSAAGFVLVGSAELRQTRRILSCGTIIN